MRVEIPDKFPRTCPHCEFALELRRRIWSAANKAGQPDPENSEAKIRCSFPKTDLFSVDKQHMVMSWAWQGQPRNAVVGVPQNVANVACPARIPNEII